MCIYIYIYILECPSACLCPSLSGNSPAALAGLGEDQIADRVDRDLSRRREVGPRSPPPPAEGFEKGDAMKSLTAQHESIKSRRAARKVTQRSLKGSLKAPERSHKIVFSDPPLGNPL